TQTFTACKSTNTGVSGPHGACLEKVPVGVHVCVFHSYSSTAPCAAGFPVERQFKALVGEPMDARSCSACGCDASCIPGGGQPIGGFDVEATTLDWVACCVD